MLSASSHKCYFSIRSLPKLNSLRFPQIKWAIVFFGLVTELSIRSPPPAIQCQILAFTLVSITNCKRVKRTRSNIPDSFQPVNLLDRWFFQWSNPVLDLLVCRRLLILHDDSQLTELVETRRKHLTKLWQEQTVVRACSRHFHLAIEKVLD